MFRGEDKAAATIESRLKRLGDKIAFTKLIARGEIRWRDKKMGMTSISSLKTAWTLYSIMKSK